MQSFREKEIQEESDKALGLKLQAEFDRELQISLTTQEQNEDASTERRSDLVKCASCHTENRVSEAPADAFLCGACYKELKEAKSLQQKMQPNAETYLTLHVECGQCHAISEVQVLSTATSIQFKCGVCSSINEAEIQ